MGPEDKEYDDFVQAIEAIHQNLSGKVDDLEASKEKLVGLFMGLAFMQFATINSLKKSDPEEAKELLRLVEKTKESESKSKKLPEAAEKYLDVVVNSLKR